MELSDKLKQRVKGYRELRDNDRQIAGTYDFELNNLFETINTTQNKCGIDTIAKYTSKIEKILKEMELIGIGIDTISAYRSVYHVVVLSYLMRD